MACIAYAKQAPKFEIFKSRGMGWEGGDEQKNKKMVLYRRKKSRLASTNVTLPRLEKLEV